MVLVPTLALVAWTGHLGGAGAPWVRSAALADATSINAVASSAQGVVAVGDGIWFSGDGRTWTPVLDGDKLFATHGAMSQLGAQAIDIGVGFFWAFGITYLIFTIANHLKHGHS